MKRMKNLYKAVGCAMIMGAGILIFLSYHSLLGCDSQAERLIQILTGLAVAITALVAVSVADPKKDRVQAVVTKPYVIPNIKNWKETYPKNELTGMAAEFFANFADPITSYKVQFKIENTSSFDWANPIVTFWLPPEKQHPQKKEKEEGNTYSELSYNSSIYNVQGDVRKFEMVGAVVISNRNLPYWKQGKHLTFWIKMTLSGEDSNPVDIEVSVDCDNADGYTKTVALNPKELLEGVEPEETLGETQG
ncbi:MAG: hypothetical protein JXN61_18720 [Sedimentisphaerales bacterium]|nr:hypothetical protein [Sedimentisphaerales bacterium]